MQRVVVRVDASVGMGLGHLTRCLTLANALATEGTRICFLMRDHAKAFTPLVESNGHEWRLLHSSGRCDLVADAGPLAHSHWLPVSRQEDAEDTAGEIARFGAADWLIVDHYALDAGWERLQRAGARRILAIDDLADPLDYVVVVHLTPPVGHPVYRANYPRQMISAHGASRLKARRARSSHRSPA